MSTPLHCYTCVGGAEFLKVVVWVRANGVVVSGLRLQTASDCIPHSDWFSAGVVQNVRKKLLPGTNPTVS